MCIAAAVTAGCSERELLERGLDSKAGATKRPLLVPLVLGAGWYHDRVSTRSNPIYGADDLGATDGLDQTAQDNNTTSDPTSVGNFIDNPDAGHNATYQLGHRFQDGAAWKVKDAALFDRPRRPGHGNDAGQVFETTALAIEGAQQGTYYGSVQWGWQVDGGGTFTRLPLTIVSQGVPSANFLSAAAKWNDSTTSSGAATTDLPIVDVYTVSAAVTLNDGVPGPWRDFDALPVGTRVRIVDASQVMGPHLPDNPRANKADVEVVDGPLVGKSGWVDYASLTQEARGT